MRDKLFFFIIAILLGLYAFQQVVDPAKIESAWKQSDAYALYHQYVYDKPVQEIAKTPTHESQKDALPAYPSSQYSSESSSGKINVAHFQASIPKPIWYDSVEAPIANTSADVSTVWQSKKRCCESKSVLRANNNEFYKTCYRAIENHFDNEELVVKCLWLMDTGATREHSLEIKRYLVTHFSHHKNNVTRCANCAPADTVARVTRELARMTRRQNPTESIHLVENILDQRSAEISPWVQTELYGELSRWYAEDDIKRRGRIRSALFDLGQQRQENKGVDRRFPRLEKQAKIFLQDDSTQ